MTESELLANETFLGLAARWEEDRHAPFPLIDFCLDHDWPEGADAARWAVEKEERGNSDKGNRGKFERTRPSRANIWWSCDEPEAGRTNFPSNVPILEETKQLESFPAAIAYYLTHFDPAIAAKYPPKREAVPA